MTHGGLLFNSRISFVPFSRTFLECSYVWLSDPEIQYLIQSPPVTKDAQDKYFKALPQRGDYAIWGIQIDDQPIGVCGLKNITQTNAEYWGYIGEKAFWGCGLGKKIVRHCLNWAIMNGLTSVFLRVIKDNSRAIHLYEKLGFTETLLEGNMLRFSISLPKEVYD